MASAMTPEPTVAIVRSERGDMAASIPAARRAPWCGRRARAGSQAGGASPARAVPRRKNRDVVVTVGASKPAARSAASSSAGRVEDLGDRERPPVGQGPLDGRRVGRRPMAVRRGRRVEARVDEGERAAGHEPAPGEGEERGEALPWHVAQPEAHEQGVGRELRLGPRVADVEVGPQVVRDQALAGELERRLGRVVAPQLAAAGEERRPPARARGELDDATLQAELVEPAAGGVEVGPPGHVVDRPVAVAAAAEVPVVVLAGPGLVVGDHLGVEPGRRRGRGQPARPRAPPRPRSATDAWPDLPGARPVRPGRRAAGSAGTGSRPPGRGSRGRAGPSPRDRRARASRGATRTRGR